MRWKKKGIEKIEKPGRERGQHRFGLEEEHIEVGLIMMKSFLTQMNTLTD